MKIAGRHTRSVFLDEQGRVSVFDQRVLPFEIREYPLIDLSSAHDAIMHMVVRGAPLIGITAAFGLALHMRDDPSDKSVFNAADFLKSARPTAVNLAWAVDLMVQHLMALDLNARHEAALERAWQLLEEDVAVNQAIGQHGLELIRKVCAHRGRCHILTHCNAGWLATGDWGTALAPIYMAHDEGLHVHVYADETRPRSQGSLLTAFELHEHGVPVEVIVDNAGGHLMQAGDIDMVIVGTDRVAANGDVANKIGTYLKALAAKDNNIPFYVACPLSTIDHEIEDGCRDIPIEERSQNEVLNAPVLSAGKFSWLPSATSGVGARNPGFDVTPARLVTAIITQKGIVPATTEAIAKLA